MRSEADGTNTAEQTWLWSWSVSNTAFKLKGLDAKAQVDYVEVSNSRPVCAAMCCPSSFRTKNLTLLWCSWANACAVVALKQRLGFEISHHFIVTGGIRVKFLYQSMDLRTLLGCSQQPLQLSHLHSQSCNYRWTALLVNERPSIANIANIWWVKETEHVSGSLWAHQSWSLSRTTPVEQTWCGKDYRVCSLCKGPERKAQ